MTDPERDAAVREIRADINGLRGLLKRLLVIVFVALTVMSVTGIVAVRTASDTKKIGEQNRQFLTNFSSFMQCLIVNDPEVVKALGKENYFNECNKLLFRGTGQAPEPVTKVTAPPTTTTTTP